MSVVDRITARLDAMEAAAKAATPGRWESYNNPGYPGAFTAEDRVLFTAEDGFGTHADAVHIALHEPAATLAMVAGLRAVVALHDTDEDDPEPVCLNCTGGYHEREPWPCPTIEAIAAMWPDTDPRQAR